MTTTNTEIEIKCMRCGGAGTISAFGHYCSGVCFECDGSGMIVTHVNSAAAKVAAATQAEIEAARAAQFRRPYTVACDNVSECVGREFATWEEAKAWSVEISERNGCTYRVAKFDGEGWRYRNGQRVKWAY